MIGTLKVLRQIIDRAPNKKEMQDFFDRHDATSMLLSVLSDPKNTFIDEDLLFEYLEFGISLLDGGNVNVQKNIYHYCIVHPSTEVMFAKFHAIIFEQIDYLQRKKEKTDSNAKNVEYEQFQQSRSVIVERLLRLLQLFTEGHYLELQNYLRHQTHSRNRYNLVEAVTELLKTYFQDLVQAHYENIVKCLDTLNEFVQGPCTENQLALIDGKFFEVVLGLLTKEKTGPKQKDRPRLSKANNGIKRANTNYVLSYSASSIDNPAIYTKPLDPWMRERLRYKVLILVNSLMERSHSSVVKRIMRALPLEVLKKNITTVYKKYKAMYKDKYTMDCFKHFEGDPNEDIVPKADGYYEMILESGFFTYFLISSYMDVDLHDTDIDTKIEIQEMREEVDSAANYLIKKNPIAQLGRFIYTISASVIESMRELKDKCQRKKQTEIKGENEETRRLQKTSRKRQVAKEAMQFFSRNSASIEVLRQGDVEKVRFIVLPYCHELPKEVKSEFNENVNRQNTKTKVEGLVKESEAIIDVCQHELRLKAFFNRRKLIAVFANFVNLWKDLAFLLSITLNLMILGAYSTRFHEEGDPDEGRLTDPVLFVREYISVRRTKQVLTAAGLAMTFCSIFVVLFFLLKRAPVIIKKAWEEKNPNKNRGLFEKVLVAIIKTWKTIYYALGSIAIVYYIAYGVFAVLGVVVHPFFFAFHLTEILFRYKTLENVIRSLWIPRKQLGLTFLLYLILNYFFTLYSYSYLYDVYDGDCESSLLCWRNTFDWTLKGNGGFGGYAQDVDPYVRGVWDKERTSRFIFDNLANIILVIIMLNIVSGIIIDTFGLLREIQEEKTADKEGRCFICGLSKEIFDRQADSSYSFTVHTKKEHYMWNYVFFIAYLRDKDSTEYTGIESFVDEKIKNIDFSWFPFNRAFALKHNDETEGEFKKEVIEKFNTESDEVKRNIKTLHDACTTLSARVSSI